MCDPGTMMIGAAVASAAGGVWQGVSAYQAGRQNAALAERQARDTAMLGAIEDERLRSRMASEIARQRVELGAAGVALDSPTAILLGRKAAEEATFQSQTTRAGYMGRAAELDAEARGYRAQATTALLTGTLGAAGNLLAKAPDLWPGMKAAA